MVKYLLVPTRTFRKDVKKLDKKVAKRVLAVVKTLASNPRKGTKLLDQSFGVWRLRVGQYRIRYDLVGSDIVLHRARHRKDIYK